MILPTIKKGDRIKYQKHSLTATFCGVVDDITPDYLIVKDEIGKVWWEARFLFRTLEKV